MINDPVDEKSRIKYELRKELQIIVAISVAIFFLVLFLQPFDIYALEANNQLLFITGIGIITFIIQSFFQIVLPKIWPKIFLISVWEIVMAEARSIVIGFFSTVALSFYIHYVGQIPFTWLALAKISIISFFPAFILAVYHKNRNLQYQIVLLKEKLRRSNDFTGSPVEENVSQEKELEFYSENNNEKFKLSLNNIMVIRSADNYVEFFTNDKEKIDRRLLRNTLKSIEKALVPYPGFIRCHRTSIVNKQYINKLEKNYSGYKLNVDGLDLDIPVSRQYLLQVKSSIETH